MADVNKNRRSFLSRILAALGILAVVETGWIAVTFLGPRKRRAVADEQPGLVVAGPVVRFEPGSVTAFREGKFYLARLDGGAFLALYRKCTHLGCTVPWIPDEQRFTCPCHASAFDIRGDVLSAPAPRALDLFPVRVENGIVKVDTTRLIRRSSYQPDQATWV
jgi:cytochrome b6-f complex iron-sulfur subunit